jgi:hypothetical protein
LIYKQNCVNDTVATQVKFVWLCTALTRIDFVLCNFVDVVVAERGEG